LIIYTSDLRKSDAEADSAFEVGFFGINLGISPTSLDFDFYFRF
jgi:hypothetical protein